MLNLFEKLINEHGSSAILKERLTILKEEYVALESSRADLQTENGALKAQLAQQTMRADSLERELESLKTGLATYVCDHCGSPDLKHTGSRDDPTFGIVGVKQKIFRCNKCDKESAFTPESST